MVNFKMFTEVLAEEYFMNITKYSMIISNIKLEVK